MEISGLEMAEKVGGIVGRKKSAPAGLQQVLNKLATVALSNSPCCLYECFAIALESDIDWRTLVDLQLAPYVQKTSQFRGDAVYISGESTSKHETSRDELTAHCHELGDAELFKLQSSDVCQELDTNEQLTDESAVLDNPSQLTHDAAAPENVIQHEDSLTFDVDLHRAAPLASCSDNVFRDQLRRNSLGEFNDRQSLSETSHDQASNSTTNTQEINVDVKLFADANEDMTQLNTPEKLITKDSDCLSEIPSTDQGASVNNDRGCMAPGHSSRSNYEYVILLDSLYPGVCESESCYRDAHSSNVHDGCSAEVDASANAVPEVDLMLHTSAVSPNSKAKETSSYVVSDPDCDNSKFADIPVESRLQHVKLTLDSSEMDTNAQQLAQDPLSPLFSCMMDESAYLSEGFASAVVFQLNAASLGGMELRDDMELIPVDDGKTRGEHNMEGTETICYINGDLDSMKNVTGLSNDSDCLSAASLGGMEIRDDMELIPVDGGKCGIEHNTEDTKIICDNDSQTYDDANESPELSQLNASSPEMYRTPLTSDNEEEQLETVSRDAEFTECNVETIENSGALSMDDNQRALAWLSDVDNRLMLALEPTSVSSPKIQGTNTTHDIGQEKPQHNVVLTPTAEVCDGSNDNLETTDTADEKGTASNAFVSASGSANSVSEEQNVDTLLSLETVNADTASTELNEMMNSVVDSNASEIVNGYHSKTDNLKVTENGEFENNTGCASNAQSTCADLEFLIGAGFCESRIKEHHPLLPLLNNEKMSSTVYYATEDSPFYVYEQSDKQLEPFTAEDVSLQTQRLELDDLTLTVTCFIPEDSDELDDDMLEDVSESQQLDVPSLSSSRKLTASDPSDLAHFMDHNVVSADNILPKRRSSEFMLSYLLPIDETAEFTDDASTDADDLVPDKPHSLQPGDCLNAMKSEPSNNEEQKIDYSINATPTVEHAYHLCHELNKNIQLDDAAATCNTEQSGLGSSLSNMYGVGVAAVLDIGYKTKCSDDKGRISCEEGHIYVENPVERNDGIVSERHSPALWFSANQQDQVVDVNKYLSEDSVDIAASNTEAGINALRVSHMYDSSEHATTVEHKTLATLQACSEDQLKTNDNTFILPAADATQHSSSTYSVAQNVKSTAECNKPCEQSVETELKLCERPVFQTNDIPTVLDAIMQGLVQASYETAGNKQQNGTEGEPLSQTVTSDRDASHSFAPVLGYTSTVVKAAVELEEPAIDALTDFESILEQLHTGENNAHTD